MVSSRTWILSLKAVFISVGVLTIALLLKASVPLALDFSVSRAPLLWSSFLSWLKPPYLYFIINVIIITIIASSRFHHKGHDEEECNNNNQTVEIHRVNPPPSKMISTDPYSAFDYEIKDRSEFGVMESTAVVYEEKREDEAKAVEVEEEVKSVVVVSESVEDGEDEFVISRSTWNPPRRMDSSEIPSEYLPSAEKPLVSARFSHRKSVKASPEAGRALRRVTKPKRHETMENTWKAITEGRAMPLTRHLKKSDTWENHVRQVNVGHADPSLVTKSETFKDRTNYQIPPVTPLPVKLRKEPSLSQDELNRRVEAFIRKFNEEMRLQRQESLNQYNEMITRGI